MLRFKKKTALKPNFDKVIFTPISSACNHEKRYDSKIVRTSEFILLSPKFFRPINSTAF